MFHTKSILLTLGLGISFSSFAQPNLSANDIQKLQAETYERCVTEAQSKEKSLPQINNYIIACMSKNGFLTQQAYQSQKEALNSQKDYSHINNLTTEEFIEKRVKDTAQCTMKYRVESEVIRCVENLSF